MSDKQQTNEELVQSLSQPEFNPEIWKAIDKITQVLDQPRPQKPWEYDPPQPTVPILTLYVKIVPDMTDATFLMPATAFVGGREPRRAGNLRPGQRIIIHMEKGRFREAIVRSVGWPKGEEIPKARIVAGDVRCGSCGETFWNHPKDRRYKDQNGHINLIIL